MLPVRHIHTHARTHARTHTSARSCPLATAQAMVFFPAGGFGYGAGNDWESDDLPLIPNLDVILVTVNYRLGALGYLASDDLRARSPDNSTGHYGTKDQRAALEWIRTYIGFFGGDPGQVRGTVKRAMHTARYHLPLP